jgi:molybdopterin-guanine dinucleotide biosynthesis protein B
MFITSIFYVRARRREAMALKPIIIAIIGLQNSGKTTVVESLTQELIKKGYSVASAKHISQKGFSIDQKGKDTWKHRKAGANPIISVSDVEVAILTQIQEIQFSLDQILKFTSEKDILLLEGFSHLIQNHPEIGRMICIRSSDEYTEFSQRIKEPIIAFCSLVAMEKPILHIQNDIQVILRQTIDFVKRKQQSAKILELLPKLDCTKCNYSPCEEMAEAISEKKATLSECVTLHQKPELKTKIIINNAELPIQHFVSEIVHSTVLGMISTLKGATINGDETIHIQISKQS